MSSNGKYMVVLITSPSLSEAKSIARNIVEKKLAACVNIVDNVSSIYWWEGKVEESREVLMIVKTVKAKIGKLIDEVRKLHSYEVPEIIALPIVEGFEKYLQWIDGSLE
ncbi:MAG: cytochrome C biogenesis protein CcdA [Desulfurococcales archaeon ex4484_217_2]|nr:MAG: cytochrome C biogenesis protein CcdA [Desulfurococcales archaeon ex4484_217_2]